MEKEQLQELIENNKEDIFSEIKDEISDDTVTDIEWDGYNLWITQLGRGCYISMKELSDRYMDNLSIRQILHKNFSFQIIPLDYD